MPLLQAQKICEGKAANLSNNVQTKKAPDNIVCNTSAFGYGNHAYATTDCYNNNGLAQLGENIAALGLKSETYNNSYISCMAEKGWNAYQEKVSHSPKGDYEANRANALSACLETHGNKQVDCKIRNTTVKKDFCECRAEGGYPQK